MRRSSQSPPYRCFDRCRCLLKHGQIVQVRILAQKNLLIPIYSAYDQANDCAKKTFCIKNQVYTILTR